LIIFPTGGTGVKKDSGLDSGFWKRLVRHKKRWVRYTRRAQFFSVVSRAKFKMYCREIEEYGLVEKLRSKKEDFHSNVSGRTYRGNIYGLGAVSFDTGARWYSIIREYKPKKLLETGVCNGISTAFILLALSKNESGHLVSIDFPEFADTEYTSELFWNGKGGAVIPKGKTPGWMIPESLKDRWTLVIGRSQEKLPVILQKLGEIDFFLHDSEHSFECMTFEFETAFSRLSRVGFIGSDDIDWNEAFYEFAKRNSLKVRHIEHNIGLVFNSGG
jgi:hypothetical protein